MRQPFFLGKKVLVLGLGLQGGSLWLIKWLCQQGAQVTVSDLKSARELASSIKSLKKYKVKLVLGSHPISLLNDCQLVCQNPAVPRDSDIIKKARKLGIPIENEASLFFKVSPTNKIVAVTGSKGKSTTTSLLGQIFKAYKKNSQVAGNIKDTVLFQILNKINEKTILVLELSSWQLELMGEHKIPVPTAVITNILPDHLNRYKSMSDYAQAKANIFKWQNSTHWSVMNMDNIWCRQFAKRHQGDIYWFSTKQLVKKGCYIKTGEVVWINGQKTERLFKVNKLKLLGNHNLENVLAAVTTAKAYNIPNKIISKVVLSYKGLHDRLEVVRELRGVKYINDTTATAPVAASAALKCWPSQKVIIIAGGQDKALPYQDLIRDLKKFASYVFLLPGTATNKILQGLKGFKKVSLVTNMSTAVKKASQLASSGQVVLLSPGAASFNLFKHEFDRGQKFIKEVNKLS